MLCNRSYYGEKGEKIGYTNDLPAKKEKEMRDTLMLLGFIFIAILVPATIGFIEMWRERHR
jgi:hypothetical protein